MNRYAITPLAEDPVVLKLDDCADWAALHERIRKTFGFPAYYGRNWDAMWDCLRDVFFPAVPAASLWRAWAPWREICKIQRHPAGDLRGPAGGVSLGHGYVPMTAAQLFSLNASLKKRRPGRAPLFTSYSSSSTVTWSVPWR